MFLEACRGSGAHSSWPARAWCLQDRGTEIPLLRCSALFAALKMVPTWCPKLLRSCIPIGPKWSQKVAKRKPKWCQHGSWRLPGAVQDLLRRPLSSWRPLGMLLESCWLQRKYSRSALGGSWKNSKTVFSDHRDQKGPKMDPRRGSKRGPKSSLAQDAEIIKTLTRYTVFQ